MNFNSLFRVFNDVLKVKKEIKKLTELSSIKLIKMDALQEDLKKLFSELLQKKTLKEKEDHILKSNSKFGLLLLSKYYATLKDETNSKNLLNQIFEIDASFASKYASDIYLDLNDTYRMKLYLSKSANKNFINGYLYFKGVEGTQQDYKKARENFEGSKDDPISLYYLGLIYHDGLGVEKDLQTSIKYFQQSYDLGYEPSSLYLEKNKEDKSENLTEKSKDVSQEVSKNDSQKIVINPQDYSSILSQAIEKFNSKDTKRALNDFETALKKGAIEAAIYLGQYYYKGLHPVQKDLEKAIKYFEMHPENFPKIAFDLASIYYYGQGNLKDLNKAIFYFNIAKENGSTLAVDYLGNAYLEMENYEKAKEYFEMNLNNPKNLFHLGEIYYDGHGVEEDYKKAFEYFDKSMKLGNKMARSYIGKMILKGEGCEKDLEKGNRILNEIALEKYSKSK